MDRKPEDGSLQAEAAAEEQASDVDGVLRVFLDSIDDTVFDERTTKVAMMEDEILVLDFPARLKGIAIKADRNTILEIRRFGLDA
jgi:hypothetical protein